MLTDEIVREVTDLGLLAGLEGMRRKFHRVMGREFRGVESKLSIR